MLFRPKRAGAISLGLILVCFDYYKIVIMLKDGLIDLYEWAGLFDKGLAQYYHIDQLILLN